MKRACPTSYVFPFDDTSSTFQCENQVGPENINGLGYTITFCPGGRQLGRSAGAGNGISNRSICIVTVAAIVIALLGTASLW